MKKLFTIAALFIFTVSLTSFTPNEVGGKLPQTPMITSQSTLIQNLTLEIGGKLPNIPM